ncbi:ABC transporter permease [Ruminococcus sp.]|uniref:ABC transporter permease n=1 Tax=Ruminococcus sp. TaxID=41978 RepID=UPI0025E2192A|nr:ABC transporter permease [Ruminococcus sp.]MBQ8965482.1 ABC transporter permease [Ruminococcus sp.]
MQLFKLFMRILKKKLPLAMVYVVVFMLLCVAFSANGDNEGSFEESKVSVVITDNDNTPESKALTDYIASRQKVVETKIPVKDALFYNQISFSLTINEGYAHRLAGGDTEALFTQEYVHESYGAAYMTSFLDEYVSCIRAAMLSGEDTLTAAGSAASAMDTAAEVEMLSSDAGKLTGLLSGHGFFRYLPYVILSVMMMSLSSVLISINSKEVRYRTNCSSVSPTSYVMQLLGGSVEFMLGVWLLFMVLGAVLEGGFSGRGWLQVLNSFVFSIVATLIAAMISLLLRSAQAVTLISNVVGLAMSFISGVFVPQSIMNSSVLAVGKFMPMYWYTKANEMIVGTEVYHTNEYVQCLLIQAGFAAALAAVTLVIFRLKMKTNEN